MIQTVTVGGASTQCAAIASGTQPSGSTAATSTAAPTATPLPVNTPVPTTPPNPCADLTPPEPGWPVSVRFFNEVGYAVTYHWIDDSTGALVLQGTISANDYDKQNTTPGHTFQFDLQGGPVTYTVGSEPTQCAVITASGVVKH